MNLLCTCLIFGLLKSNFVAARWSTWGAWGHCSVTCGTGTKVSHRTCSHGSCDGSSTKTTSCHPTPHTCPPVDGHWTAWRHWGSCSATCEGTRTRSRVCHPPEHGGAPCRGNTVETSGCGTSHCPVNGGWSGWTHPTACSVTCGGGVRTWTRTCNHPTPAYGGLQCRGESHMSERCNGNPCPVNGGWSGWNHPSACSVTCGGGVRTRTRTCNHPTPAYGGHQCQGVSHMSEHCNENPCPVNGVFLAWGDWSPCSVTCGSGSRVRSRACIPPKYGGLNCTGTLFEINNCIQLPCQIDGQLSDWGSWSQCSATCEGLKSRSRTCSHPQYGGAPCTGQTTQTAKCGTVNCPGVTCPTCNEILECTWNTTCPMSETCLVRNFPGYKFTTHCIMKDDCEIMKKLQKSQEQIYCCDDESCLQNILGEGRLSDWTSWGQCSATCEGLKSRTRTCNSQQVGDVPCIDVTQTAKCGTEHCPVDGDSLPWGDWSPCSVTCGSGTRVRSRACIPPQYGGHNCTGPLFEMNICSPVHCPTSPVGVTCPTCTENMECTWNTTCHVSENCMIRAFPGYKFTTHCIMKDDCALMKLLGKTHGQIFCCDDESCLRTILGN